MINSSRGKNVRAKQEEAETNDIKSSSTTITSSSRQWAGFKNPRIVRVSRSFGGKDRHSKVCTIRGLRDRRIRLSVPSAIQLYDLQDRLGLNQPSKVVDWLLDVTKDDIDKLPPLQMPPGDFTQFYQQTLAPHHELINSIPPSSLSPFFSTNSEFVKDGGNQVFGKEELRINDSNEDGQSNTTRKSKNWPNLDTDSRAKNKEIEGENINKWNVPANMQETEGGHNSVSYNPQLSAQNFLPLVNQFPFPSLISNTMAAYNWEPPSLSLSQFGTQVFPSQVHSQGSTPSGSLPPVAHPTPSQLIFYPPYRQRHYSPLSILLSQVLLRWRMIRDMLTTSRSLAQVHRILPLVLLCHLFDSSILSILIQRRIHKTMTIQPSKVHTAYTKLFLKTTCSYYE